MTNHHSFRNWYLTRPEAISRLLVSIIRTWGYPVHWNFSDDSESVYLKVCLGTRESPKAFHIRISNHSIPPESLSAIFHLDVYSGYEREGAVSYVKAISKLAKDLGKTLPDYLSRVCIGTEQYKLYRVEMQRRKKHAKNGLFYSQEERFYVKS